MKFAVDAWDPSYGASSELEEQPGTGVPVDVSVEVPAGQWQPVAPSCQPADQIAFVDGVRRVEARVWLASQPNRPILDLPAQCASWGAGAVLCATGQPGVIGPVEVGHVIAAGPPGSPEPVVTRHATYVPIEANGPTPPDLWLAVQEAMARGERRVSELVRAHHADALLVVDGPLRGRDQLARTVGYVKSHHVRYVDDAEYEAVMKLAAGQRSPLFLIGGAHPRFSWYVRLADGGSSTPLADCVRVECSTNAGLTEAVALADVSAASLPLYASEPHKDRRAPQNLSPIAGLERQLRHLLGDPQLLYRSLRVASRSAG